jgi:hypothetical protein
MPSSPANTALSRRSAGAGYEVPLNGTFSLPVRAAYTSGGAHVDLSETSDMTYAGNAVAWPVA